MFLFIKLMLSHTCTGTMQHCRIITGFTAGDTFQAPDTWSLSPAVYPCDHHPCSLGRLVAPPVMDRFCLLPSSGHSLRTNLFLLWDPQGMVFFGCLQLTHPCQRPLGTPAQPPQPPSALQARPWVLPLPGVYKQQCSSLWRSGTNLLGA